MERNLIENCELIRWMNNLDAIDISVMITPQIIMNEYKNDTGKEFPLQQLIEMIE
jgi:hypothetical protein